jgi:hypothetical protein
MNSLENPPSKLEDKNPKWVFWFALLVAGITTLPYLIGYGRQGEAWRFSGFVFGVEDGNSYIAKMLSGTAGAWLFRTPYTSAAQRGVLAFLPYILLGKLASPPGLHEQLVTLFHLFRIAASTLEIYATYRFLSLFFQSERIRKVGLVMVTLGGGLGWLLVVFGKSQWLGSLPLEFYSPETFGFLGIYGLPHLALARAGLLWGLCAYLEGLSHPEGQVRGYVVRIGLSWFVVVLAQPLTGVIMGLVFGIHLVSILIWQVVRKRNGFQPEWGLAIRGIKLILLGCLLPLPFLAYNFLAFSIDPFLKAWTAQNIITSPHPLHYLSAYGLVLPFAFLGSRRLLKFNTWKGWMLVGWALVTPVLVYMPFNLQRRMTEGVWVALVILALWAFENRADTPVPAFHGWMNAICLLSLPSTFFLIVGGVLTALHPARPVFSPADEVTAFEFLATNAKPTEVVLTAYETGNVLPAWAPVRVVIGHGPESVGLADLLPRVKRIYSLGASDEERLSLLKVWQVRYIFYGPDEAALGDWQPGSDPYLHEVYQSGTYSIFQFDEK